MTITNRKSKGKARASSSNVLSVSTRETEEGIASLTSSGEEKSAFAIDIGAPSTSKTLSCKQYFKQYGEPITISPYPVEETIVQPAK